MESTFFKRVTVGLWRGWKRQLLAVLGAVLVMTALSTGAASAVPPGAQAFLGSGQGTDYSFAVSSAHAQALHDAGRAGYPASTCYQAAPARVTFLNGWYHAQVTWVCGQEVPGTVYNTELKAGHTGMCAAVGDNSTNAGMWFIQYKCDGKNNKKFDLIPAGAASQYYLKVRSTGMCMVPESTANHAEIVQNTCQSSDQFRWTLTRQGDGKYTMANSQSNLYLGVAWGMTGSGQPLDQATGGAHTGQAWTIPGLGSPGGSGGGGGGGGDGGGETVVN